MKYAVATAALLLAAPALAKHAPVKWTGLTCKAGNGAVTRLNIDVASGVYQREGDQPRRIESANEAKITLQGPSPDLMNTPMGPLITSLELDRRTLVLTDTNILPARDINRTVQYQCEMGPGIDFGAGRKL